MILSCMQSTLTCHQNKNQIKQKNIKSKNVHKFENKVCVSGQITVIKVC